MDENVELFEVVVFDCPTFTSPEKDVHNILQEDLVFEVQLDVLVVEEVT